MLMSGLLDSFLPFALLPTIGAIVAGAVALARPPDARLRGYLQHFAAGVVFSVVAIELLPEVVRIHESIEVLIGFGLGVIAMLGIKAFGDRLEGNTELVNATKRPSLLPLMIPLAIDILLDGLLLGIGFLAGESVGQLLAIALTIELISLALAFASTLSKATISKRNALWIIIGLFALIAVGALLGVAVFGGATLKVLEVVFSFGMAALLYLVTEELLVEAHEEKETPIATAMFFAGFLAFLMLDLLK